MLQFSVNGQQVEVDDDGASLLEVLRDRVGVTSAKDGCSPQGQCGCCTVWVDGQPRVACVTPAKRARNREVTTLEGIEPAARDQWTAAFTACGASQCGFCTPGIIMRLAALPDPGVADKVDNALLAHLCRCTGWQTIKEAAALVASGSPAPEPRNLEEAAKRAEIEGGTPQAVGPAVASGDGGFADDNSPAAAMVALTGADGSWVVGDTLTAARRNAGKVQGRRTTVAPNHPIEVPPGDWDLILQTTWVEPAYLEPDASWAVPGGPPASPLGNGGAFGGKAVSPVVEVAAMLAAEHGGPVRAVYTREDTVRLGPKRPPVAAGVRADGTGSIVVARTAGVAAAIADTAPGLAVTEVDLPGPPTSADIRGAGWVEAAVLLAGIRRDATVVGPSGATATATVGDKGISVTVRCGRPLDEVVLRSYCIGAAHMAYSWVTSEALAVDDDGQVLDLTIRSFGIVRAKDMPRVEVTLEPDEGEPVNGSDAVFAAVAAATWIDEGLPPRWPTRGRNP
ncbi:MAG: 2Fe-2S iron-sulfur cluster-binding protein [Acidimicrobiales bacterium]